ncbi:MAG: hypothetical protein K0V04_00605 [Deltaproteobacteria bacterium]|nr:hypothetical protein [Deltaproteobacteria bacterium]
MLSTNEHHVTTNWTKVATAVGALLLSVAPACEAEGDADDLLSMRLAMGCAAGPSGTGTDTGTGTGTPSDTDTDTSTSTDTVPSTGDDPSTTSSSTTNTTATTAATSGSSGFFDGSSSGGSNDCLAEAGLTEDDLTCPGATEGEAACACDDPCGVQPPANEVPCNFSYEQTCTIIDGIEVCDNEYVPGEYQCLDFTNDFCEACTTAGVPTWTLTLGCVYRNYHACLGYEPVFSHATAIVEVDYPGPFRRFCVVEPQNNQEVYCWVDGQAPGDTLPAHVMDGLHAYYDAWGYQDCIDDGWTPYVDVY